MQKFLIVIINSNIFLLWVALFTASCLPSAETQTTDSDASHSNEIVAIVHGFGRTKHAMWLLTHRLETEGYRVALIDYKSLQDPPEKILEDIKQQIVSCCLDQIKTLHFVGYSLGGLLVRAYLADQKPPNLGRVVIVGTPSKGTKSSMYSVNLGGSGSWDLPLKSWGRLQTVFRNP